MIKLILDKSEKKLITFLNPYSYLIARKNKELFSNFNIKIDGILLAMLVKIFADRKTIRESFDMTSLAPKVFSDCVENEKSIFLLGSTEEAIECATIKIKKKYPLLKIVGHNSGFFSSSSEIVSQILSLQPDIVVCGMGTPNQEKFLFELYLAGFKGMGYTCGGFFHQTAKGLDYYPSWIDKYNLRFAYRLYDEPIKILKRLLISYPIFIIVLFFDFILYKIKK